MSLTDRIDRRTLLIGGGIGVGLVVAYAVWPAGLSSGLATRPGEQAFGGFIKIARGGTVTVAVPQTETGQGAWTALPQIVADELGAAWENVAVDPAPLSAAYANPLIHHEGWLDGLGMLREHRLAGSAEAIITAGATSVRAFAEPMRLAAATARAMLVGAAADRWNVNPSECETADSFVMNGGRSFNFGELAEEAADRRPPVSPALRTGTRGRLIGKPLQRLDGPAKASGKLRFAGDVRLPDMLYASVRLAPAGGRLTGLDKEALTGSRHVAARDTWIAVVADTSLAAERALHAANPRFEAPAAWADVRAGYEAALTGGAFEKFGRTGDYEIAVRGKTPLSTSYFVAPARHLTLEPMSATARWSNGSAELWLGSQAPGLAEGDAALFPLPVGGPDGRAMENPLAAIVLELAAAVKGPVQVTLPPVASRLATTLGPGLLAEMNALLGDDGFPLAWRVRAATANGMAAAMARLAGADAPSKLGALAMRGAAAPYGVDNAAIEGVDARPPFATGYMRGSPEREYCFANESFVDELARRQGMEPLAYRMSMLGGNARLARCFQSVATFGEWDGGGGGSNMGIAGCTAFGSAIALVATASIGPDQQVKAHRLVAAVDCGSVVNAGLAAQQVEGALMWALAQATGAPVPLSATPEIAVHLLPSTRPPGGLSGLGALPLAPALANAIHAATGRRLRSLPFDPMAG